MIHSCHQTYTVPFLFFIFFGLFAASLVVSFPALQPCEEGEETLLSQCPTEGELAGLKTEKPVVAAG